MSITYSLQNLLLDDPDLDHMYDQHDGLLGPVERMRWISNLVRLAVIEGIDQLHVAAGEYTEYQAEIRRLRRASMAPDAGRYYSVEGKANRVFKNLDSEQARQIVEHWRTRQLLPDEDPESEYLADNIPNLDNPGSEFQDKDVESEHVEDDESEAEYLEDSDEWSADEYLEDEQGSDQPKAAPVLSSAEGPLFIDSQAKHQTRNTPALPALSAVEGSAVEGKYQTRASRVTSFAVAAAVAVFAALLILAATWFLESRIQTEPQPAPADILSTTKIVPSGVPRRNLDSGLGVLGIRNPHPNPEP